MGVRLPPEYQEVEYLESTGTQYISTRFHPTPQTRLVMKAASADASSRQRTGLGYMQTSGSKPKPYNYSRLQLNFNADGSIVYYIGYSFGDVLASNENVLIPHVYTIDIQNAYGQIDNNSPVYAADSPDFEECNIMYHIIFAYGANYREITGSKIKVWYAKYYDNDVLVRDFVPCYRKSDSATGMYDLVGNEFYPKVGTGEFILGPNVIDSIDSRLVARRQAIMAGFNSRPIIPRNGLIFGFQPDIAWNQTKPSTLLDITGNTSISVAAEWGESLSVSPNLMVNSTGETWQMFEFYLNPENLIDGFTETIWFVAPVSQTNFYFNTIQEEQLAWIYGYNDHMLEFYNYRAGDKPTAIGIFRDKARKTISDSNRHFAALSYNAKTGGTIFVVDNDVIRFNVAKRAFIISDSAASRVGVKSPFNMGQFLMYRRPLSEQEITTIRDCNGKWK